MSFLPFDSRRKMLGAASKYLFEPKRDEPVPGEDGPPRLTSRFLESLRMSRSRDRIMANLDEMYREAFERAKTTGDDTQLASLDFAYRREQLYFEVLLDVRDSMERR